MKTKLQILLTLVLFFGIGNAPLCSLRAADPIDMSTPVISNSAELPSVSFMKKEKRSIASTVETASLSAPMRGFGTLSTDWEDPFLPGDETSNAGNVGAPVGDATWPILVSILIIYMLYRSVTVSRRKNNF